MKEKMMARFDSGKATVLACCILTILYYGLTDLLRIEFGISTSVIMLLVYALLLYKIVMTTYTRREKIMGICLTGLGLVSLAFLKDTMILTNILVLFSLKKVDLKRLFRAMFWSALMCYILVIVCSLAGIGLPVTMTRDFRGTGEITRYCFGYAHPNSLQLYTIRVLCLFVAAYFEKIDWKHICGIGIVNYAAFYFSDSRTGFICGCLLVVLLVIYKYAVPVVEWKLWKIGIVLGIVALLIFGIGSVVYYGKVEILNSVNSFFTGRLRLAKAAFDNIGLSWWGSSSVGDYIVDNGYVYMLLGYGVVNFGVYWLAMFWLVIKALREKEYPVIVLILVFCVYALMEGNVMIKVIRNIPMVYFAKILFDSAIGDDIC